MTATSTRTAARSTRRGNHTRRVGRVAVLALAATAAFAASPVSADLVDDLSDFFGFPKSINKDGGYLGPCNVVTLVQGAEHEAPADVVFFARREQYDPATNHTFAAASKAAFWLDGTPIPSTASEVKGQFTAAHHFAVDEAAHHELKVVLTMPQGLTCTHTQDVWIHPASHLWLTTTANDADPSVWKLHAGLLVDWENASPSATYSWSFGKGTPLTQPDAWGNHGSDVTVKFPGPGSYMVKVTVTALLPGRTVTLTRSTVVAVDGQQAGQTTPQPGVVPAQPLDTTAPTATVPVNDASPSTVPSVSLPPTDSPSQATVPVPACTKGAPDTTGATPVRGGTTLTWAYVFGAEECTPVGFRLQVSTDSQFASGLIVDLSTMKTMYVFAAPARTAPTQYWFRVAVEYDDGTLGPWSDRRAFDA